MTSILIYNLKVGILITVCYTLYRLLLERDTSHHVSRTALLTSMVLSMVLPLCTITLHQTVVIEQSLGGALSSEASGIDPVAPESHPAMSWPVLLSAVCIAGTLARLAMLARYSHSLQRLIRAGHCRQQPDGTVLCIVDASMAPFSWWHTIVISRTDYESSGAPLILIHERSHIHLRHSMDVVFVELLTALQWFNPVVWMLSRDLRTIHEYEADEAVLSQGAAMARYITLLTCRSSPTKDERQKKEAKDIQACVLANGVSTGNLKKRIDMMMKPKNNRRWSSLKALYVIPVAAITLMATAKTVTNYQMVAAEGSPHNATIPSSTYEKEDSLMDTCEVLPEFPGGGTAMMQFLMENMKYPAAAKIFGVQGRVFAQFIVEKDGSISHVQANKVTDTSTGKEVVVTAYKPDMTDEQKKNVDGRNAGIQALKDEAVRVVSLMPKWAPGKQQGQTVRVKFTVPITFRLN